MEQLTQIELEKRARYYMGVGLVFADDFIQKNIGTEKMKTLGLSGAYVIRIREPMPCLFITFGAGGSFVLDYPVARVFSVSKTEAEQVKLSWFIREVDPDNKYNLRIYYYHIDLAHGSIIKRPSDEDIAKLQLDYRDFKISKPPNSDGLKRLVIRKKRVVESDRLHRELRALDRRRLIEAGVLPPIERGGEQKLPTLKGGPRRNDWKIKLNKLDSYRSDTDEEVESRDLFGEDSDEDDPIRLKRKKMDDEPELDYGIEIKEDDDTTITSGQQQFAKRQKLTAKTEKKMPLEIVLTALQTTYQQKRLHK